MAYSKDGRYERANKSAHSPIINDPTVQEFLKNVNYPVKQMKSVLKREIY